MCAVLSVCPPHYGIHTLFPVAPAPNLPSQVQVSMKDALLKSSSFKFCGLTNAAYVPPPALCLTVLPAPPVQVSMKDARAKEREFFQGKSEYQDLQVGAWAACWVCVRFPSACGWLFVLHFSEPL